MTYSEKLQDPRWQKKRLEILERDKFTCVCCGDTTTMLQVHHLDYSGNPWDVDNDKLITTCKHCHTAIEFLEIKWLPNFKINKVVNPGAKNSFLLSIIRNECITFLFITENKPYPMFNFSHNTASNVIHDIIDFWMANEQQHLLTDKKIL